MYVPLDNKGIQEFNGCHIYVCKEIKLFCLKVYREDTTCNMVSYNSSARN